MANVIVLLIILICVGFAYLKTNLVKSFALIFFTIFAAVTAFAYFEILAQYLIKQFSENLPAILPWLPAISFFLIFALVFALLYTIFTQILKVEINLNKKTETIGKIAGGIILGFIFSGIVLTILFLAPLPNLDKPAAVRLNPDGFVTGLFAHISSGSLSSKKSFGALHPDFIGQLYLNKIAISDDVPIISDDEISLPAQNAAWIIDEIPTDENGQKVEPKGGNILIALRTGLKRTGYNKDLSFTISQIRLVCNKNTGTNALKSRSKSIHPIGYITIPGRLKKTGLNEKIILKKDDLTESLTKGTGKLIDFVFEMPKDLTPFAIEFRLNNINTVPALVTSENAPATKIFIPSTECTSTFAELESTDTSAKIHGISLSAGDKLLQDLSLNNETVDNLRNLFSADSNTAPDFEGNQFDYAKLKFRIDTQRLAGSSSSMSQGIQPVATMLLPLNEYKLLDLKCNSPAPGVQISTQDLPTLIDIAGNSHHPVGIIASGKIGNDTIFQIDYCAVTSQNRTDGLIIGENQNISKTFISDIWLPQTQGLESVSEFYLLYLIKGETLITNVQPANTQTMQTLSKFQAFLVK